MHDRESPSNQPPRRSVLYVPGSNARALAKAAALPADAFIFDLEDAVAPEAKSAARQAIKAVLDDVDFGGRECAVRVNALSSPWGRDDLHFLTTLRADRVSAVVLPKVEDASEVAAARALLGTGLGVWCMLETPRGVLAAQSIAAAAGVVGLVAGTSDLSKALGVRPGLSRLPQPQPQPLPPLPLPRLPLLYSLSHIVLAARAAGVFVLDGVCLELEDAAAFEIEAEQGVALGFDGKTLIHPKTIAATNRLFAPSNEELAAARRIVDAGEKAAAAGLGVVVVDGRLVESLHVAAAKQRLSMAARITAAGRG